MEITQGEFLALTERVVAIEAALMTAGIPFYERTGPSSVALRQRAGDGELRELRELRERRKAGPFVDCHYP